jgi:hypothetical protein
MTTWQNTAHQLGQDYLQALREGNLGGILSLFAEGAQIISPLYGQQAATTFYAELLSDTQESKLTYLDTLFNEAQQTMALLFRYEWQLANGQWVNFVVMDYLRFDPNGKVTELQIIYDTQASRSAWSAQREG